MKEVSRSRYAPSGTQAKPLPMYSAAYINALEAKISPKARWRYVEEFRRLRLRCGVTEGPKRKAS